MLEEVLIAGFGGQGVLSLGKLIAQAAMEQGLNASWLPSYGPEMRGGTANCTVCFSDDEIGAPIAAQYDAVIAMNQPSLDKFEKAVRPGGVLLINRSIISVEPERSDIEVHYITANDLAESVAGTAAAANVVALGALHAVRPRLETGSLEAALQSTFGRKGQKVVDANIRALHAGMDAMAETLA
ncbi:MAG TPA: 2-oxoacid:acceptor oxidoreductase family protein [Phycisphaerae bacterium]|nr:2-oxoacid:acceptor oxidoreductase family protein [Phycisphaerales bacterium]HRX84809.1 2-oxoacid:acceptor oxidoreductase family protein [Phycisphaerae bacterium]